MMRSWVRWISLTVVLGIAVGAAIVFRREAQGVEDEKSLIGDLGGAQGAEETPPPAASGSQAAVPPGAAPHAEKQVEDSPRLDWLQDPELDALRMEVYKAELRSRYLKATAEIREIEKRLSGKAIKDVEAPKPIAPPKPKPKSKLIAVDGKGAIVEVDGRTYSFAKVGDREGKVTLKGVGSDRALIEVDGDDYEAKF